MGSKLHEYKDDHKKSHISDSNPRLSVRSAALLSVSLFLISAVVTTFWVLDWTKNQFLPFSGAYLILISLVGAYALTTSWMALKLRFMLIIWLIGSAIFLSGILLDAIPEQTALIDGAFEIRPEQPLLIIPAVLNGLSVGIVLLHWVWLGRSRKI